MALSADVRTMTTNLRERLSNNETLIGTFQICASPMVAETLGEAGMDFVIFDQEHGPLTAETLVPGVLTPLLAGATVVGGEPGDVTVRVGPDGSLLSD